MGDAVRDRAIIAGAAALYRWECRNIAAKIKEFGLVFDNPKNWRDLDDEQRDEYVAMATRCIDAAAGQATMEAAILAGAAALVDFHEDDNDRAAAANPNLAAEFAEHGLVRKTYAQLDTCLQEAFRGRAMDCIAAAAALRLKEAANG